MAGVNRVILIGNLGKDPETRHTQTGAAICSFSLATNESWKNKDGGREERTEWHNIVTFGKVADICGQYLQKGKQVYIEGRLQTRSWDDRDGNKRYTTEIVASNMTMLGRAGEGGSDSQDEYEPPPQTAPRDDGDSIPF